jgi:antitoxin (DNA-binding transcriptional repressor) of toxin-antitoxin stability system
MNIINLFDLCGKYNLFYGYIANSIKMCYSIRENEGEYDMLTKTIDVHNLQISLEEILSLVREGTEIIFTDSNTPLARIVPFTKHSDARIAGLHAGAMHTSKDFNEPLTDEFWTENQ